MKLCSNDHSDANTRRVFGMMAGPGIQSNISIGSEGNAVGDLLNITPTIAEILGFKQDVINTGLVATNNSFGPKTAVCGPKRAPIKSTQTFVHRFKSVPIDFGEKDFAQKIFAKCVDCV